MTGQIADDHPMGAYALQQGRPRSSEPEAFGPFVARQAVLHSAFEPIRRILASVISGLPSSFFYEYHA